MIPLRFVTYHLGRFSGNLTFTLSSGLNVTVYNHQLVRPEVIVDDDGSRFILRQDIREIFISNKSDNRASYDFGRPFLSSVYLHVNNEEEKFTIWRANPTLEQNLVSVVGRSPIFCANPASNSKVPQHPNDSVPAGVIAGAVIGGIAALLISGIAIFFLYRRRKVRRYRRSEAVLNPSSDALTYTDDSPRIPLQELSVTHPVLLPTDEAEIHEMRGDDFFGSQVVKHHDLHSTDSSIH